MSQYGNAAAGKNPPWVRSGQNISVGVGQPGQMPPSLMANAIPPIANASVLQYPQQQVFQGQMGIQQAAMNMGGIAGIPTGSVAPMQASLGTSQMYGAVGAVTYPTRALNSAAFQGSASSTSSAALAPTQQQQQPGSGSNGKQRVFTGTVTKVQDNFGFVDEDVFFQTSCCVKGMLPQVGDRVLVEALYNANMPFKWNATRIQVLPMGRTDTTSNMASMPGGANLGGPVGSGGTPGPRNYNQLPQSTGYNAVPPPSAENSTMGGGGGNRFSSGGSRFSSGGGGGGDRGGRDRGRDRPRQQRDDPIDIDRKRRRDDRDKDRDDKDKDRLKSPPRKRSKSPPRQRRARRVVPRYSVQVPKMSLDSIEGDVLELRRRYSNMYIPSDFFNAHFSWVDTFPLDKPVSLNFPCSFHIMHKDVEPVISHSDILEPPDMDYLYSAKVMLLSSPGLEEFYSKCVSLAEDRDKEGSRSTDDDSQQFSHPARLISFMVGLRGKNETMAIGGPWSPSLDGENPQSDPGVLIKTATRNCRSLTGIDLSSCTQWFRFLEIHYHRAESVHKGRQVAARVETVVMFVPDVWSCLPTRLEWDGLQLNYQRQCSRKLNKDQPAPVASATPTTAATSADEKEDDSDAVIVVPKREPRHYSELDPKNMKVNELREELEARSLSPKGLKSQLVARLAKVIKTEADEEAGKKETPPKIEKKEDEDKKKKEDEDKKKFDERDRSLLEKRYKLPESPHIIVHPNRTAKSGKFDCTVMTLSSLLGYRQDDTKEHSFEVSLFAELFNEMLMRDFGFKIYRSIVEVPEKTKEEKDDKDRKKDKLKDGKDDKDNKDKDGKDKEKRDDDEDDDDMDEDDDDDKDKLRGGDKKDDEKKRIEKLKLITVDPLLLLSYIYFDTTRCGYIFDKDLEDLLYSLGLSLSRAQVKKLVQKVVTRDSLHYRRLTDKPKEEHEAEQAKINGDALALAQGNKHLIPRFCSGNTSTDSGEKTVTQGSETSNSGYYSYKGTLVDVGKLIEQLSRSEAARVDTEKTLVRLRQDYGKVKENLQRSDRNYKELHSELKDFKERLANANSELCNMDAKARLYYSALSEISEKVKPLLQITVTEPKDVEIVETTVGKDHRNSRDHDPYDRRRSSKDPIASHWGGARQDQKGGKQAGDGSGIDLMSAGVKKEEVEEMEVVQESEAPKKEPDNPTEAAVKVEEFKDKTALSKKSEQIKEEQIEVDKDTQKNTASSK